ncbi:MAG: hypothetical protein EA347_06290 [Thioalkalivibrio sp.]|nr:MAG: hypothetical protein EA347_06290 [Thioalkalivibrio sp.]
MAEISKDIGVLTAIAERMVQWRLPRAQKLKERVDQGEVLTDSDIAFLQRVFRDAVAIAPLVERNPQYRPLAVNAMAIYRDITAKALKNQEAKSTRRP